MRVKCVTSLSDDQIDTHQFNTLLSSLGVNAQCYAGAYLKLGRGGQVVVVPRVYNFDLG
jgi:hypothetical protein